MKKNGKTNKNNIRQPHHYKIGGVFSCVGFILLSILYYFVGEKDAKIFACLILFMLCFPGLIFIIYQVNWKIEVKEDEFIYKNMFGRIRTYKYDQIEIKYLSACIRVYQKKRHIVGIGYENAQNLIDAFNKYTNK